MGKTVIGLLGLPGAGKTTAGEALADEYNTELYRMGDVVRDSFAEVQENGISVFPEAVQDSIHTAVSDESEVIPAETSSDSIGEWVTMMLDIHETVFAETAAKEITEEFESDIIIVDGIRTLSDIEAFKGRFERFELLHIYTPFVVRAERLIDRGREGEDEFDLSDVAERDERELDWGVDKILSQNTSSTFYNNSDSIDDFQSEIVTFTKTSVL